MKNKTKKIKVVKEKLTKEKEWHYDLYREMTDDNWTAFTINWTNDNRSHWADKYGPDKDKFHLFIGGGQTIFKEDKAGRKRSTSEGYDLKITKDNAEDLICILEAFLELQ